MGRRIVTAREQVEMLSPWREAGRPRRFNQDWQHIGGDYMPLDVISHYMDRKGEGFGDEKAPLYEMTGRPPLSQQITEHGYEKPVELATDGKSGIIYDGHHRIDIARQLGHTHVPVTVSWRNSTGYDDGAYGNKIEPWLKGWLTDMRKGRETVGRRTVAERIDDFEWQRSFDGPGGWILVTRTPDGNPVTVKTEPTRGQRSAALDKTLEQHLRDTYEPHPPGDPGLPESLVPHLMLPTDIAHHYREYDRPVDDENTAMLTRVIADQGIRQPLRISTDGTHAILHEGNHRLSVARQLGMSHVPVQVTLEKPGEIMTNSADSRPVPLEPVLREWVKQNRQNLKSFWS